jgi:hypothetical protein
MFYALAASLALAVVMTTGDFAWAALHIHHRTAYGIAHGAAMCLCIGIAIGIRVRRPLPAAIAGPLIGVAAAATYYVLASPLKWGALFPAWMLLWILFALLQKLLTKGERIGMALKRGILAALLSGFAFYLISDIWIHEARHPGMMVHFGAWAFAFLPGFAALFAQLPMAHRR